MATRTKPRKKVTTVTEEIPEGTPLETTESLSEFDIEIEQAQDIDALNAVLDEYGIEREGRLFRIYKILPNGKPSFCYEDPKLDYVYVQQQRGEGSYIARLHINGKWKRNIEFSCEPPITNNNGHQTVNHSSNHEQFLERMLMVLLTNQGAVAHTAGPSLKDITETLVNLDAIRGKQESAVELLMKGMEMADRFGGGSRDWKSELLSMGKDALPAITSIVQTGLAARNGQVPPPQPTQPLTPDQQAEQMRFMLVSAIGMLKNQFMAGLDVDSAINLAIANSGNPMYQPIIQTFIMTEWDELVKIDADLSKEPIQSKFRALHDGLRSEFSESDSMESDSGRDSGNGLDTGNDVRTSKTRK